MTIRAWMLLAALGLGLGSGCGGPEEDVLDEDTLTSEGKEDSTGKFCGGIAGIKCPTGYTCQLSGTYPDAGGKCVKKTKKCGPFLGGTCGAKEVCDIRSCGLGATGTCVTKPTSIPKCGTGTKCYSPVCGCNGTTYSSDAARLMAGVALDHQGACSQGKTCGGIAGLTCPSGQKCKLAGSYPDASGTCVPEDYCDIVSDCKGLVHVMCVGAWQCLSNKCSWHCGIVPPVQTCGPFPGGLCGATQVCNIKSCGLGGSGTCVTQPQYCAMVYSPVCGCDGKTYGNDCERLRKGAALSHKGAC